jgi:cyclopropane fatty-acyl-phospholipid synthase-like methyltransferase
MIWELRLNISTRGLTEGDPKKPEHIHYGTISYHGIFAILRSLALANDDVVVDLGCGKGRVLCCAAQSKVRMVIGIEYDRALFETAKKNAEHLRGKRSPIHVTYTSAQDVDYTVGTIFYLFHPFGPGILKQVLQKIKEGREKQPRAIRIVYVNPVHEKLMEDCGWLERYAVWETSRFPSVEHPVSFWRAKEAPVNR